MNDSEAPDETVQPLRWRRDGNGGFVARPDQAAATYRICPMPNLGRSKSWKLYIDGIELIDASGCMLRYVKHRASSHAAETKGISR